MKYAVAVVISFSIACALVLTTSASAYTAPPEKIPDVLCEPVNKQAFILHKQGTYYYVERAKLLDTFCKCGQL